MSLLVTVAVLRMCMCLLVRLSLVIGYGLKVWIPCVSMTVGRLVLSNVLVPLSPCVQAMFVLGRGLGIGSRFSECKAKLLPSIRVLSRVRWLRRSLLALLGVTGAVSPSSIGLALRLVLTRTR